MFINHITTTTTTNENNDLNNADNSSEGGMIRLEALPRGVSEGELLILP